MSEHTEYDSAGYPVKVVDTSANRAVFPSFTMPFLTPEQVAVWARLVDSSLEEIRAIIRQEIDAAFERQENRGLDNLMDSINAEPEPEDEIVAVLATMTEDEWQTLVQRVHDRRMATE